MKTFSKAVGVVSAVSVGVDIINNFITYGNSFENFTKANLTTVGVAGAGVLAGVGIGALAIGIEVAATVATGGTLPPFLLFSFIFL